VAHNSLYTSFPLVRENKDAAGQAFMNALVMPLQYREVFRCD